MSIKLPKPLDIDNSRNIGCETPAEVLSSNQAKELMKVLDERACLELSYDIDYIMEIIQRLLRRTDEKKSWLNTTDYQALKMFLNEDLSNPDNRAKISRGIKLYLIGLRKSKIPMTDILSSGLKVNIPLTNIIFDDKGDVKFDELVNYLKKELKQSISDERFSSIKEFDKDGIAIANMSNGAQCFVRYSSDADSIEECIPGFYFNAHFGNDKNGIVIMTMTNGKKCFIHRDKEKRILKKVGDFLADKITDIGSGHYTVQWKDENEEYTTIVNPFLGQKSINFISFASIQATRHDGASYYIGMVSEESYYIIYKYNGILKAKEVAWANNNGKCKIKENSKKTLKGNEVIEMDDIESFDLPLEKINT